MVTSRHEASHRIFQERPELLRPVFQILGVPYPAEAGVEALTPDTTEIRPLERRVDSVLRIKPPDGGGFLLAIEAQGRRDEDKAVNWAYYLSHLKAKYQRPALLLVVCQDKATATWASGPFELGTKDWTALSLHPLVLSPGNVPEILDQEEAAKDPTLATFSALTHGRSPNLPAILEALARALGTADPQTVKYCSELLEIGLGDTPARETWRMLMPGTFFPGRGTLIEESFEEGREEGRAEERARLVLVALERRGISASPEVRQRVTECKDLDTLQIWLDRAFSVATADELFADEH
ncbi:hypothetical protein [Streptomyces orinoci]|uniref:DUF4351 domain-containing protein n=1 Tax=Streptomyces orinoci TaxID=67339 RepID=A0ABV3K0H8_STRON|nr:hypothetical protein [Streptomyces orinoci]